MEQPDNMSVQVIENRVFIEGVILCLDDGQSEKIHHCVKINISRIEQVENYPDLVTVQGRHDFRMLVRKDDRANMDELIGKTFTCLVSWIMFDRLFMLKDSLQVIK